MYGEGLSPPVWPGGPSPKSRLDKREKGKWARGSGSQSR